MKQSLTYVLLLISLLSYGLPSYGDPPVSSPASVSMQLTPGVYLYANGVPYLAVGYSYHEPFVYDSLGQVIGTVNPDLTITNNGVVIGFVVL